MSREMPKHKSTCTAVVAAASCSEPAGHGKALRLVKLFPAEERGGKEEGNGMIITFYCHALQPRAVFGVGVII